MAGSSSASLSSKPSILRVPGDPPTDANEDNETNETKTMETLETMAEDPDPEGTSLANYSEGPDETAAGGASQPALQFYSDALVSPSNGPLDAQSFSSKSSKEGVTTKAVIDRFSSLDLDLSFPMCKAMK